MTFFGAAFLTAIATVILAVFAIVTAWYARKAFLKQSQEVAAIERQVADGQELSRQQAELLQIQAGQLEVLRAQLEDQRSTSAKQAEVLELQATGLQASLEERKREAERQRRGQAARVFLTEKSFPGREGRKGSGPAAPDVTATVVNSSSQPIYDVEWVWRSRPTTHVERSPADAAGPNPDRLGVLLPGERAERTCAFAVGAIVRFTDAAGIRWVRRPDGYFTEQG